MLTVLRNRWFAALFASQVSSLVATGLLTVALALVAVRLDPGAAAGIIGTALTIRIAVYVVVSPLASALLAGRSSRAVLVGADLVRLIVAGALVFATAPWQLYVGIVLLQTASAVFTPTYQAVIPRVLPDERDYTAAQSLSRLAYDLESLLSPPLAALLVLVLPPQALFGIVALGFLGSGLAVLLARLHDQVGSTAEPVRRRLLRGLGVLARTPGPRFAAVLDAATATIYATVLVSSVVLLIDAGADPVDPSAALAAVLVAFGLGSIAVAVALPALLRRLRDTTVMLLGAGVAVLALACAAAAALLDGLSVLGIGALWAVLGASSSAISTPSARLIRTEVAADQHAAVFAARFSTSHAWYAVTYPVAGLLGTIAPSGAATAALAGLAAAALLAGLAMVPPRSPD
ncbi:MFS transporter [Microcella frigidaquae]|uniref:MFS family permease n=1 Tax=Microcella frigidaquae TaxID=424758 RepID=A0A840XMT9_9MICO|nr:MFS transporter [Microcella frigidaquae]MBB5617938.1 MFS family permease [Microcella frigidaquae]NHN44349.1 MFS transporter [Microcella frigidaquae]